ncbi:uncharacterized protein LOC103312214 [Tribolium castaneum]|uniref:Uncharacterized protein n=1 Tax=Tribolium castaneum TaxID=7070 RepID=D6WED5_TRICA|nr:PREDICTED: uncharacterized protein LOC103312214 [Tribolium castaneum]EFA00394.2 hypothetical protein TcasGA2_TC003242 [Tribolium castaneum]|eukprot:XP_008190538.1 PREDICTED: uncharacterized protein LOC103312214 [Tribolium castaneum]
MGVRSWRSFFVLLWVYFFGIKLGRGDTICDLKGCNCTVKVAKWKSVNCSLSGVQELRLDLYRIPLETVDVFITGGEKIALGPKSFDQMPGLALLHIEGTRSVVMEKQSFRNVTTPSLIIQIQNCDQLSIKTGAFDGVQSSIEVEIVRCGSVNVEKTAFGKLKSALFRDVEELVLATETFEFKNQGSIGRHGPVTTIFFDHVTITTIPPRTFFSSLADVTFRNSHITEIKSEAFSANQISSITFTNSSIDYIDSNSFISRTLIYNFKLQKCTIKQIREGAVMSAITNLTVQHSNITEIQSGAINSTVAKVDISDNAIRNLQSSSVTFNNWNKISFDHNIVFNLHAHSIQAPVNPDVVEFSFSGNEIFKFSQSALSFVPDLDDHVFVFKDNFFEQTCHCTLDEWIVELINANITTKINKIANNTFCRVTDFLSQCFELKVGVINVKNFTQLVCNSNFTVVCEPYKGETKIVNTTIAIFTDQDSDSSSHWLTVIITTTSILILLVIITSTVMLIRGSRWLKRKGYFRKIQYNQNNEHSNDEENTIETVDEGDKLDISEDLTMELLQDLSKKLDDPLTHQEASEMIEQLYQKYIHNMGSENNNQQEDEAHLYEELGNLQIADANKQQSGPRSILRLMEEKFNTHFEDIDADDRPALVGEYSEPSDAAVHLYSELRQNKDESENKDSLKSRGSSNMAFRPLPDKPGSSKML